MGKPRFIEIVLSDNGFLHLEVWRLDTRCLDRDYESLLDLLNALLTTSFEDADFLQVVAPDWRESAIDALDSIIPIAGEPPRSLSEKFMMYQQVHGRRDLFEYQVHIRKDHILTEIWNHAYSLGEQFRADSYAEISAAFEKYGLSVPVRDYYGFDSNRDFNNWVLQKLIDLNPSIHKCAHCNRYFVPSRPSSQKCCSAACKQAHKVLTDYCGVPELAKLANAIKSIFDRKVTSDKKYRYLFPKLDSNYDSAFLFKQAKVTNTEPLTNHEFARLRQAFSPENNLRLHSFSNVHALYSSNKLSEQKYIEKRDEYITWMTNVHVQLKAFSSSKKLFKEFERIDEHIFDKESQTLGEYCSIPRTIAEICTFLGYKSPGYVKTNILAPLLKSGNLIVTNPKRPKSKPELFQTNLKV